MFHHPFVIDHYEDVDYEYIISELLSDSENDNNAMEEKRCFICLEKNSPISLQNAYIIKKKKPRCGCKEMVHIDCLEKWYHDHDNDNTCPMCNTIFNENDNIQNARNIPPFLIVTIQFLLYFTMTYCLFFFICLYLYFFHAFFTLHSKQ
jgi:transcription initiation factor IIE alpha subunit